MLYRVWFTVKTATTKTAKVKTATCLNGDKRHSHNGDKMRLALSGESYGGNGSLPYRWMAYSHLRQLGAQRSVTSIWEDFTYTLYLEHDVYMYSNGMTTT